MTKPLALALLLWSMQASAALEITISSGETRPLPIAIVPFGNNQPEGLDLARVVEGDLKRSGFFAPTPRTDMLEKPTAFEQVDLRNWRALGVEHVVVGQLSRSGGAATVRFELVDTVRGERTLGYEIPIVSPDRMRTVAHQISDYIYEKLTGYPGYFNTQIAYVSATGPARQRRYELVVSDVDGANERNLARSPYPIMSPAWSPDRRRLAYVAFDRGRTSIIVQDVLSGNARKLVSERGINGAPAWSPDGKKLAVALSFETNPDIYIVDVETQARRRLTQHYGIDTEPSWSPDGRTLVFTSDRGGQPQVYEIDVNGDDNPRRLTFEGRQNTDAVYSPDGTQLALVNYDQGLFRVGLLDLKTRSLKLVSDGPLDESPSFAPNGVLVTYTTSGRRGAELVIVSTNGGGTQRLGQSGDVRDPAWSPR